MNRLTLSKVFYRYEDLLTSISEFEKYAIFTIKDDTRYWIVEFNQCKFDTKETMIEFENYLIDLTYRSLDKC